MWPETLGDLYRTHWGELVRLAAVVSGDLDGAPDIVQEVYADLVRDAAGIRNPTGWLRTAVVHRARSWARRAATRRRYLEAHGREHTDAITECLHVDVDVRGALAQLNPDQRATIFLRYYLDLSVEEIAATLECRAGTVKSRLNRAHARLEAMLCERS